MATANRGKKVLWFLIVSLFHTLLFAGNALAQGSVSGPEFTRFDQGTVTITIENPPSSSNSACDIVVTNTIPPAGFAYVSGTSVITDHNETQTLAEPAVSGGGALLTWDINTLLGTYELPPSGTLTIAFDLKTDCTAVTGPNSVALNYNVCGGGTPPEETFDATFNVITDGTATLTIEKNGANGTMEIDQCDERAYVLTVTNTGTNGVALDTITDTLPQPGFSYVDNSAVVTYPGGSTQALEPVGTPGTPEWDLGGHPLGAGDVLTIEYSVATHCESPTNLHNEFFLTYEDCSDPGEVAGLTTYELMQKALSLTKTPAVAPAAVGQTVTWTITAENTGEGTIRNVVVSDNWEAGLGNPNVVFVSDGIDPDILTSNSLGVTFPEILPGESKSIVVELEVLDCENLSNYADARWGCNDVEICYDSAVEGDTILASIKLIVLEPLIKFNPPDIVIAPYCSDGAKITLTVYNDGDGAAGTFELYVDLGDLVVSDIVGDLSGTPGPDYENMVYATGGIGFPGKKSFWSGDSANPITIPADERLDITFTINYADWCAGGGNGNLIYAPYYRSGCDAGFAPPVVLGSYSGTTDTSSLTVSKTGAAVTDRGAQESYIITAGYTQPEECARPYPTSATIVDTIPDGWTIIDPGTGNISDNTITWEWNPSTTGGNFSDTIILQAPSGCEACNSDDDNTVVVTLSDCCGCALNAEATHQTIIRCDDTAIASNVRTATPVSNCGTITYTNTLVFDDDTGRDYSSLIFTEEALANQVYVPGSLEVRRNGNLISATPTNPHLAGSPLVFDKFTSGLLGTSTLVIAYQMQMTPDSTTPCGGTSFRSWANTQIGTGSSTAECPNIGDSSFTEVSVQPPGMSTSVGTFPFFADKCAIYPLTVTVNRTSGLANPYDVRAVLDLGGWVIVSNITCSGVAPDDCTPADLNAPEWLFQDRFAAAGAGAGATIQFDVQGPCAGGNAIQSTVFYDDQCDEDDDTEAVEYDNICTSGGSDVPGFENSANLVIKKTPEKVFTVNNQVSWIIYVSNIGAGTTFNLEVVDELDSGINYVASTVTSNDPGFDAGAVTTQQNGQIVTWNIPSVGPGYRVEIEIDGVLSDCVNLNNNVSATWGCLGEICELEEDTALVLSPAEARMSLTQAVEPVVVCENTTASIFTKNTGTVDTYDLTITDTLPPGVTYVTGSAQYTYTNISGDRLSSSGPAPEPNILTYLDGSSLLTWGFDPSGSGTFNDILATMFMRDTLEITFEVAVDCDFVTGDLSADIVYHNPCRDPGVTPAAVGVIQISRPELEVVITRLQPDLVDCGDEVTWTIAIINNGPVPAQVVQITDTLGDELTFGSLFEGSTEIFPTQVDNSFTWEIRDLSIAPDNTRTFTLTATLSDTGSCDPTQIFNEVEAVWGCLTDDGAVECFQETGFVAVDSIDRAMPVLEATVVQDELAVCLEADDPDNYVTVMLTNTGTSEATGIDATITLPEGMRVVTGSVMLNNSAATPNISGSGDPGDPQILQFYDGESEPPEGNDAEDLPDLEVDQSHEIRFRVTTDCLRGGNANIGFAALFRDCCGTPMDPYAPNDLPITLLTPAIVLTKTQVSPDGAVDCDSSVQWRITVENQGNAAADIVRLTDTLGAAFTFVSFDAPNHILDETPVDNTSVINWEIAGLDVDETRTYILAATTDGSGSPNPPPGLDICSDDLDNTVDALWGCVPEGVTVDGIYTTNEISPADCTVASDRAIHTVERAIPELDPTITIEPDNLPACSSNENVTVIFGLTMRSSDAYWVDLVVELPEKISYVDGTTDVDSTKYGTTNPGDWPDPSKTGTGGAGDPQILTFYDITAPPTTHIDNIGGTEDPNSLPDVAPGGTINLGFDLDADCFAGGPIRATLYFYDCCGVAYTETITHNLTKKTPVLELTKTLTNQGNCTDPQIPAEWEINVNNSAAPNPEAEVVLVEDALPPSLLYVAGSGSPVPSNEAALASGSTRVILWEFPGASGPGGVNHPDGWSATFQTTVDRDQITGCDDPANRTNPVRATWGCAGDAMTYDGLTDDWNCPSGEWFETETLYPMADLVVDPVDEPEIVCQRDGIIRVSGPVTITNNGSELVPAGTSIRTRFRLFDAAGGPGPGVTRLARWFQEFALPQDLAPGESFTYTLDRRVRSNACDGADCTLSLVVDLDRPSRVCECNEENNQHIFDLPVNIPDLVVEPDVVPEIICDRDGFIRVIGQVTVTNQGCGPVLAGTIVPTRFRLFNAADGPGPDVTRLARWIQDFTLPQDLAPGESFSYTLDRRVRTNACADDCTLSLVVDLDHRRRVCECDGGNNRHIFNLPMSIPDLVVNPDLQPEVVCDEDGAIRVTGQVTVTNQGCGLVPAGTNVRSRFRLFDAAGGPGPGVTRLARWFQEFALPQDLAPGESFSYTLDRRVVTDACDAADCTLSLVVDLDRPSRVCECARNNRHTFDLPVHIADLTTAVAPEIVCVEDGVYRVTGTVSVADEGCGDPKLPAATVPVTLSVHHGYVDENNPGVPLGVSWTVQVAPDGLVNLDQSFTANICDLKDPDCRVTVRAEVDTGDPDVCECNGENNIAVAEAGVNVPDLEVDANTLGVICEADGQVRILGDVTLINNGCDSALDGPNPFTRDIPMRFNLYAGDDCTGNLIATWDRTFTNVLMDGGGGTQTFVMEDEIVTVNPCEASEDCAVTIEIIIDPDLEVCECDGTDNVACTDPLFVDIPDLIVQEMQMIDINCIDSIVEVALENIGCGDAPAGAEVVISGSASGTVRTPTAIPPGGTAVVEVVLSRVACGSHDILATVDPGTEICECASENNENELTFNVPCTECRIDAPDEACAGDGIEITARLLGGEGPYQYRWEGPGAFEPARGTRNSDGTITTTWTPPADFTGRAEIRLEVVDGGGCETECRETVTVVPCERTPLIGDCCLAMTKEGQAGPGLPEILPVDLPLWFDTAQGLFAASEMARFAAEAADEKMAADRAGRQYQRLAGFMKQFARNNTGAYTLQSGLGALLPISAGDLAAMADQAGLEKVPLIKPIAVPYAGGLPLYQRSGGTAWNTTQADRKITPGAIGAMLSAQAGLLPELAAGGNAADRFTARVMVQQMANAIAVVNRLPVLEKGAFGKAYDMNSDGSFELKQGPSSLADQALLLSGLLDARGAFTTLPEGLDDAITKAWQALQSGFDAATGLYSDAGLLTANGAMALTGALATLSGQQGDLPMAGAAGEQLAAQVAAVAEKLVADDGAVYAGYDLVRAKNISPFGGAKTLDAAASALAALLNHASGVEAAKRVYGYMNRRLWDAKHGIYRDTADWFMTGRYSARTLGAVVGGLGRLALITNGDEKAIVIDRLAQFVETVAVQGGLQLDGQRGGYLDDPGAVLLNELSSEGPRRPLPVPSRRYRDRTVETGLGFDTAPVLNSSVTMNFAPLEAERLQALVGGIANRPERFEGHWPLYVEPERVPKLGNRSSEPAANLVAAIALVQAAPGLQALSADQDNGFTGRSKNLGVTAAMLSDRSAAALARLQEQLNSGALTLAGLFPAATEAELQLLADAMTAPDRADLTALAEIDLRPDNDARESLAYFAKPMLALEGDALLEAAAAFDKRYWSDRIGTYLADEQHETQVGVRTTRYIYSPDDIGLTVAALTRVLSASDSERFDRLARRLVAFITGIMEDTGVRMASRPVDEIRGVDLFLVDRERAYPGDTVKYTLVVSNGDGNQECDDYTNLPVEDQLPAGARYVAGSARVDGVLFEPVVQGGKLTWTIAGLSTGETVTITYRVRLRDAAFGSSHTNRAVTGIAGCLARASAIISLGKAGRIKGVLFADGDGDGRKGVADRGLSGIRVILDENRATDTDPTGTFWFEDLVPGVYQVRIDSDRLPEGLVPTSDPVHTVIIGAGETYLLNLGLVQ